MQPMSEKSLEVAVLMADISGSSALYDEVGDIDALRQVGECLDNMIAIVEREGGTFIRSKGDDVLAIFSDPGAALAASRAMLALKMTGSPLASDSFVERLTEADQLRMRPLDTITFKGKDAPTGVFTFIEEGTQLRTVIGKSPAVTDARQPGRSAPAVTVTLRYADETFTCPERKTLSIGRSMDNDIVIEQACISREHARIQVRRGKVQLPDEL